MQDGTVLGHVLKDIIVDEEAYCHGHVAAEIIQAINWVQCRKITDDDGGCPETDIYILFNNGNELEKAILEAVEKEMDGIQIIPCYDSTKEENTIQDWERDCGAAQEVAQGRISCNQNAGGY